MRYRITFKIVYKDSETEDFIFCDLEYFWTVFIPKRFNEDLISVEITHKQ